MPAALEGLLSGETPPPPALLLRERLRDARGLDEAITAIGQAAREEDFRISVATMEGRLDADEAGIQRTAMAEAALASALRPVLAEHAARYGRVRGGGMVVVAMGKAGGREMMAGSDLDLMFIYDHPASVSESTVRDVGKRGGGPGAARQPVLHPCGACLCRRADRRRAGRGRCTMSTCGCAPRAAKDRWRCR